ncbi:hypothetical protein BC008_41415 [Mastigocoleus testarum BC008]|uniref:Uncharacterized protein n=1 Tax=Mastigocoleus testarum BC008 TaxID=371196 RepID=A0A0V7ZKA6_9CYAN|nr:hypothetical protein BC008_40440 [Mastigocoleus testarum BC008]KST64775.1 hypothetical protein BC008_41415 [Mastigocoleus testarum BC008]
MGRKIEVNWILSYEQAELLCRYLELCSMHKFDGFNEDSCKMIIALKQLLESLLNSEAKNLTTEVINEDDLPF